MGKTKVPEAFASPSSLSLHGQGDGEHSAGLKANLIRSRTLGPEECRSLHFHPSLGSCLVTDIGCASGSDSVSVSHCFSVLFKQRTDLQ